MKVWILCESFPSGAILGVYENKQKLDAAIKLAMNDIFPVYKKIDLFTEEYEVE